MNGSPREIGRGAPFAPAPGCSSLEFDCATDLPHTTACPWQKPKVRKRGEQDGTGATASGLQKPLLLQRQGVLKSQQVSIPNTYFCSCLGGAAGRPRLNRAQLVPPHWIPCVFSLWNQREKTPTTQGTALSGQRQELKEDEGSWIQRTSHLLRYQWSKQVT